MKFLKYLILNVRIFINNNKSIKKRFQCAPYPSTRELCSGPPFQGDPGTIWVHLKRGMVHLCSHKSNDLAVVSSELGSWPKSVM